MPKSRVEAFSDGVIAILITIMVLELKAPHDASFAALRDIWPTMISYILSFVYLGIYWNNHHHMFQAIERVNGTVLWANLHLLFWLSLVPFFTEWMGTTHFETTPCVAYGVVLMGAAVAYFVLQRTLVAQQGHDGRLARAIGRDIKGKISPVLYLSALPLAYVNTWISLTLYAIVALLWVIPDRRLEVALV